MAFTHITPSEARLALSADPSSALDVREPSEFASGRIPGARSFPLSRLEEAAKSLSKDTPLIVYCQSGRRSQQAAEKLDALGFTQVSSVEGGFSAWKDAGFPSEKTAGAPWTLERQVRFTVGVLVIAFTSLGFLVHPGFLILDLLIACGLIFSAITNTCGLALVLTKMPWNQRP